MTVAASVASCDTPCQQQQTNEQEESHVSTEPVVGEEADKDGNKREREPSSNDGGIDHERHPSQHADQNQSSGKRSKRRPLHVEAIIQPDCPTPLNALVGPIEQFILAVGQSSLMYRSGAVDLRTAPQFLRESCVEISIVDIAGEDGSAPEISVSIPSIGSWNITEIKVHAYVLCDDEAEMEELENADDEDLTACETLTLPNSSLHGIWDSLILPREMKENLLQYSASALLFSDLNVSPTIIDWNRVVLLHGPPGTGKTSLCRALAQKLAIRMSDRFTAGGYLVEIHSHSLFSKWFSESGKLVSRLFNRIREMVEDDPDALCCVLVDEVESLAAARAGGGSGGAAGEPSDAIRAVNSLLTSLDRLRKYKNVIVMTTTNLTGSVDVAFVDRADIKMFIGLPILEGRYEILRSCVNELIRVGIVAVGPANEKDGDSFLPPLREVHSALKQPSEAQNPATLLLKCAELADGLSGRSLRKAPFQSHAMFIGSADSVSLEEFLGALNKGIIKEQQARQKLESEK